ncbi:M48 family metalloprotease [Alteraurantiacibacter aquimixticola]|uniref:Peptidase M48 domain-containing protein n=1 Tax=Alteraurantiacibacter aquimixticola TaxID=2489173 RepID=A0A4T3EZG8_9SPHN|nr:M48 family metalloprotease [Alteraurantiacibacter aquimixticola]TIX50024.1 hypothetical protein E5222_06900 [Alteraurantiacibacter aquimixticola]
MVLHSADQYAEPPELWFAQGDVAIAAVVPGSAADRAGLMASDALVRIDDAPLASQSVVAGEPLRDTILAQIAGSDPATALRIGYRRDSRFASAVLDAQAGCRALVEVLVDGDRIARSDGRVIQISLAMMQLADDRQLAAIFAHELAHSVLEHRRRLEETGVRGGLIGQFGRHRRLGRIVEIEADRLSVHLLANAGYDPQIAPDFWEAEAGRRVSRGLFNGRRHPSRQERIALLEAEIAEHGLPQPGLSMPAQLLAARDLPFPSGEDQD